MDDLIRRSDAIKAMAKAIGHIVYDAEAVSQHVMNSIPAAEPKQGEWTIFDEESNTYECTICGEPWTLIEGTPKENYMNFCPNCGAKMKGADDEHDK